MKLFQVVPQLNTIEKGGGLATVAHVFFYLRLFMLTGMCVVVRKPGSTP